MLFAIVLFSCDENATCIDADDFGDLEREIIEVSSSDTFKCTVSTAYKDGDNYMDSSLSDFTKVNPTLKECLTTNVHINASNDVDAEEIRALFGETSSSSNLKGCQDYLTKSFDPDTRIAETNKNYTDYCETFCENLCNTISSGNDASPWIANTPRKENSDIGVNITPGSKISVTIQEGLISLPTRTLDLISYTFDPHNFSPNEVNALPSISTGSQYDIVFSGEYFDNSPSASNSLGVPDGYARCGSSPSSYTRSRITVDNNRIKYDSLCGPYNPTTFAQDSLIFARRNIIYFEPYPNQNDQSSPVNADPSLWSCSENFPIDKAKIQCGKGADTFADDNKIGTSSKNIIKNGGFIRANDEVFVIKDEIIKNIPASSTTPIIFSTNDLGNSGDDVFVDLKSDCENLTLSTLSIANDAKIYYTATNLTIPRSYSSKNIPVYKGASLTVTFASQSTACTLTAKTKKYLDIPINTSGVAEFQMKDLGVLSFNDIPNFNVAYGTPNYFECDTSPNSFIKKLSFTKKISGGITGIIGIAGSCDGTALKDISSVGGQYLGSTSSAGGASNADIISASSLGFTKIQAFRDNDGITDIILFNLSDDSAILASTGAAPTSLYNCDSDPNCQELSCNGGRISGIKAQHDSSSIKALSIICSENYVPAPTTPPENSCTLYGRIINHDDQNLTNIDATTLSSSEVSQIISLNKIIASTSVTLTIPANNYVKKAYLGLQTYANSTKKSLTNPECKIPLDITNCSIGASSCVITSSDVKTSWLYDCYNGDGLSGIKKALKAGTGGAGGGNNSKETRVKNGYTNDSAQAGKNGESYVNPEFGTIVVADYAENADKGKGGIAGGDLGSDAGSNGHLELSYDNGVNWYSSSTGWVSGGASSAVYSTEVIISSIQSGTIRYKIKGGGGGAGGSCAVGAISTTNGGNGANGDSFSGSFTLPSGTWTLKVKIGQGGGAGANCSASPSASNSDSANFFKGGSGGGATDSSGGGGGAGGSASYIAVARSDETHDNREDFLVIAGGGGGGGGATSQNAGTVAKSPVASPSDQSIQEARKISYDLRSNAKGYRLGFSFEPLATQTTPSDFYEYDNFFTKSEGAFPNSSGTRATANVLYSDDPLNKIVVTTTGSNKFFVRKGQVLRILPKSFEKLWNSKEGPKECGVGMILKVTPRPALLCLKGIEETMPNPFCIPDYIESTTDIALIGEDFQKTSTASPAAPQASGTQKGCMETTTCQENPIYLDTPTNRAPSTPTKTVYTDITAFNTAQPNSYYCPIQNCADVTCSTKGSPSSPNSGCTEDTSTSCNIVAEAYNADNNVNPKMYSTQSCNNCVNRKKAEKQTNPKITIPADNNFNCYSFESYNKSANKFLSLYNNPSSISASKKNLIDSETAIVKVPPANTFGSDNNFGNIQNFIVMDNKTSFLMKQSVSTNLLGNFKGFVVHNDNFKNAITSVDNIYGTTKIQFTKKGLFSNGQQLAVALCKEDTLGKCSALNLPANKAIEFIPLANPSSINTYFTFDSASGSIKRILASDVAPLIGGGKCDSELLDEKFICFKGIAGESADEIKKYRLSFKIIDTDDIAENNSGSYKVRIEKREALKSRAGGIINGVLGPITMTMEGSLADDANTVVDERIGLVQNFYVKLISNPLYKRLLTLSIVLALSFYGMGYLIGVNELKNSEIVKILLKIGFIYLFTSTETGIVYFNTLFVGFFKDAINYITFSVAETFDTANSNEIRIKIRDSSFYDKGILFKSVDKVIDLLMTGAVQKKILALLFSSIFGWIYFLIIYYCLMTYIYAIANSMLLYITCQIMVSILFVLGPIFFIFLMFKVTKDMFDNWLKALIGFSLQQIFLVMTLSLFNTFVYSFLKLALGYRICWTNVLSLNLIISKVSLFNFWSVAGTNSPESGVEDSPDSSFGSDENMPSLYLFLYLMIVVSLMKKFIQMFTDLAVSLAGGLKASTISAEAMSGMKSAVGAISQQVGKVYQASVGRVVANIDNTLFDSGRIAKSRKASEREQFASNMMTRASLHKAGNDAVSKYKKENGLKLSNMSSAEQKSVLEDVRMKGIKEYASENDIGDKRLDSLLNKTGLDYNGSNLFGLAAQVAKQGVSSGGNLFTAVRDKKVETSFSKTEANAVIKKIKTPDQQNEFINNVKDGKVHVNKGKMEKARSFAISAVKEPVKAVLNPKATASKIGGGVLSLGKSAINMVTKSDPIKKEAVDRLKESGQIAKFNIMAPEFVKNWARTDEEKKIIRDKMRDVSREKGSDNTVNKVTSKSVVRDLELTSKHAQRLETRGDLGKQKAHIGRFKERVQNVLSPNPSEQYKQDRIKDREERKKEREDNPDRGMGERLKKWAFGQIAIKKGGKNLIENAKENLNKNKALEKNEAKVKMIDRLKIDNDKMSLKNPGSDRNKETLKLTKDREKAKKGEDDIGKKLKEEFGDKTRFGLLKEMKEDLKNFDKNGRKFSDDFNKKINGLQDEDLKKGLQKNIKVIEGSGVWGETFRKKIKEKFSKNRNENYVDGLIKKEIAENPKLKDLVDKRSEFRVQINEADAKIKNLGDEKIDKTNDIYEKALKINKDNVEKVEKYEKKDLGERAGKATLSKLASATAVLSSAVVNRFKSPVPGEREEYKKALSGVKEFNNLETTKDFEKFVKKGEKKDVN